MDTPATCNVILFQVFQVLELTKPVGTLIQTSAESVALMLSLARFREQQPISVHGPLEPHKVRGLMIIWNCGTGTACDAVTSYSWPFSFSLQGEVPGGLDAHQHMPNGEASQEPEQQGGYGGPDDDFMM